MPENQVKNELRALQLRLSKKLCGTKMKQPTVYILASKRNGTLYVGVTSHLIKRIYEHKNNLANGFTKKYHVHHLVYYELYSDMVSAISREKQIKKWDRQQKLRLIETNNPHWKDLYPDLI